MSRPSDTALVASSRPPAEVAVETLFRDLGVTEHTPSVEVGETITPRRFRREDQTEVSPPPGAARSGPAGPALERLSTARNDDTAAALVLGEVLGEGGMGQVLSARQRCLAREVAVKTLREETGDHRAADALVTEALVTGALEHPSIVPVHLLGRDDSGRPVLVMKRVEGVSWDELLRDPEHPMWVRIESDLGARLAANLDILMRVCDAAHFAHSRGVIHRDIKPANVMIGAFGEVYLVDWGVALRLPPAQEPLPQFVGTPAYLAPEMVSCDTGKIDARTDVYLLGGTLHRILTGKPRHTGPGLRAVLAAAHDSLPEDYGPEVPKELAAICNRACQRDPAARFDSALELRHAIADFLRHRASIELCHQLAEKLARLEAAIGAADEARLAGPFSLNALLSQCRFGFEQALREWPANPAARDGLVRVLQSAVLVEIRHGDLHGARDALEELGRTCTPTAELVVRLEQAEAAERRRASREVELSRLERDLDIRVASRERVLLGAVLIGVLGAIVLAGLVRGERTVTHRGLIINMALAGAALAASALLGRRRLLSTALNRRLVFGGAILIGLSLANRIVGAIALQSIPMIAATDMLVISGIAAAGWAPIAPRCMVVAAVSAAGSFITMLRPETWRMCFLACMVTLIGVLLSSSYLRNRARPTA